MIGQMVITFRESFEAILLLSILTAYLKKTGRGELIKNAYYGVILALIIGLTVSVIVLEFYNGFENKELFEGVSALIAVVILTSMIYWMGLKGSSLKAEIMRRVDSKRTSLAILGTAFFFVVREVIETILFLIPFAIAGGFSTAIGSIAGLSFAILFSLSISNSISKVKLRRFSSTQAFYLFS
jgi:high-affinity iron transporter